MKQNINRYYYSSSSLSSIWIIFLFSPKNTAQKTLETAWNVVEIQKRVGIRHVIQKRLEIRLRNVSATFRSRFRSHAVPKRARGTDSRFGASEGNTHLHVESNLSFFRQCIARTKQVHLSLLTISSIVHCLTKHIYPHRMETYFMVNLVTHN